MYPFLLIVYGFLAAAAALLFEIVIGSLFPSETTLSFQSTTFIVVAAFFEEGSKWIFFRQFYERYHKLLSRPAPLTLGLFFGTGFTLLEGLLIWLGLKSPTLALFPLLGILSLHLLTSLFFAYYLFRLAPRVLHHTISLIIGMTLLHTLYNLFLV